jgi:hypothetical protein
MTLRWLSVISSMNDWHMYLRVYRWEATLSSLTIRQFHMIIRVYVLTLFLSDIYCLVLSLWSCTCFWLITIFITWAIFKQLSDLKSDKIFVNFPLFWGGGEVMNDVITLAVITQIYHLCDKNGLKDKNVACKCTLLIWKFWHIWL